MRSGTRGFSYLLLLIQAISGTSEPPRIVINVLLLLSAVFFITNSGSLPKVNPFGKLSLSSNSALKQLTNSTTMIASPNSSIGILQLTGVGSGNV